MRAIVVGAGGVARDLLRRLGEIWEVTLVDISAERLDAAAALEPAAAILGDGSSRVVLGRAGLTQADALVAATDDDDANLEICRIGQEVGIQRLIALAANPERIDAYRRLGVTTISSHGLAARRVELNLETRRVSSMAFADGRAEAMEFRIAPDSPVRGKPLRELRAHSFIVGAILRGDRLIVPHGETVLEAEDLVTVVGAGSDFSDIVRTFTSGEVRFPLDFGKRVAVAVDHDSDLDGSYREAIQLVRASQASSVVLVHRDPEALRDESRASRVREMLSRAAELSEGVEVRPRAVDYLPARALSRLPREESIGVIVIPAANGRSLRRWTRIYRAISLVRRTSRPVLLSRGQAPYGSILVPARSTLAGRAAARAAIDLARLAKAELHALAVVDPLFLAGPAAPVESQRAIAWLEEEAAAQGVRVEGKIRRGNPVRTLRDESHGMSLVVLGVDARRHSVTRGPGIGSFVAGSSAASVLLVPV